MPENALVRFQKKGVVESKSQKLLPINNDDFQFRMAFNLEEDMKSNHPFIKNQYLDKYESLKKYYRYINRVEFSHPDFPILCHMSIVKSSKKNDRNDIVYERSIQHTDIFKNAESYEIELELDNAKIQSDAEKYNVSSIMKQIRLAIKYVLCGLQNTKYPVSYKTMYAIEQQYKEIILRMPKEKMKYKLIPRQFIGPGSITLQRKHVASIDPESSTINIRNNYCVTEKADGDRRLLYISGNGKIIFAIDY